MQPIYILYTHVHTYTDSYIHTYTDTYIHTYTDSYIHTYTDTYIHTYIHRYIHTYTPARNVCVLRSHNSHHGCPIYKPHYTIIYLIVNSGYKLTNIVLFWTAMINLFVWTWLWFHKSLHLSCMSNFVSISRSVEVIESPPVLWTEAVHTGQT